jgi:estrone sulfotransferase
MQEFKEVDGELGDILSKKFTNAFRSGYVKIHECILPGNYKKFAQKIEELQVRDDDLWVVSFPKTGKFYSQPPYVVKTSL